MTNKSNARFLGNIISEPLKIVKFSLEEQNLFDYQSPLPLSDMLEDGDAPEPDPEELPDMDWAAQKTEYEL